MKKTMKLFSAFLAVVTMLAAMPHASAATNVNAQIEMRLKQLSELCTQLRDDSYVWNSEDDEALFRVETLVNSALSDASLTDEAAVAAIKDAQEQLRGMEATSVYGLSVPLENLFVLEPHLFKGFFCLQYHIEDIESTRYQERYYHYQQGAMDWALVRAHNVIGVTDSYYTVIGNRVFTNQYNHEPFVTEWGIYDVEQDRFYPLYEAWQNYDGVTDALEQLGLGRIIGDIDGDGRLTVKDVTELQRCLAEYRQYPLYDNLPAVTLGKEKLAYLTDLNRNGRHDVADVTALQKQLLE